MIDDPNKPKSGIRGLLDYAKKVNENTGLSRAESFAAALDPLIMKDMRAGDSIRAAGERRVAAGNKNKTMQMLIDSGQQDLADAVASGAVPIASAVSVMFQRQNQAKERGFAVDDATTKFERDLMLKKLGYGGSTTTFQQQLNAYTKAFPNLTEAEILDKISGKDDQTAKIKTLDTLAKNSGLVPGTPDYQEFMASSGESLKKYYKDIYENKAEQKLTYEQMQSDIGPMLKAADDLASDPYLNEMLGGVGGRAPALSPEARRVMARIDYLLGQAFMAARDKLKGGGQITDYESDRAEAAMIRIKDRVQSPEDYRRAIQDFKDILQNALERQKFRAEGKEIPDNLSGQYREEDGVQIKYEVIKPAGSSQ